MISIVNRNHVESSEGYGIRQTDSYSPTFQYFEGDHVLEFHGERTVDSQGMYSTLIFISSIQSWLSPQGDEIITEEYKALILRRIKEGLTLLQHNPTFYPQDGGSVKGDEHPPRISLADGCKIRYEHGDRTMLIPFVLDSQLAPGHPIPRIRLTSLRRWSSPHDREPISEEQQRLLSQHLMNAMPSLGYPSVIFDKDARA